MGFTSVRFVLLEKTNVCIGCFHETRRDETNEVAQLQSTYHHMVILEGSGHCFTYVHPNGSLTRQVTPFALSTIKEMVYETIQFRNAHVSEPYVHHALTPVDDLVKCHPRFKTFRWPVIPLSPTKMIDETNGWFTLHALDHNACLKISPNGKMVRVDFLMQVIRNDEVHTTKEASCPFTRVFQVFSTLNVPERFSQPTQIVLEAMKAHSLGQKSFDPCEFIQVIPGASYIASEAPCNAALNATLAWTSIASSLDKQKEGLLMLGDVIRLCKSPNLPCSGFLSAIQVERRRDATFQLVRVVSERESPAAEKEDLIVVIAMIHKDESVIVLQVDFFHHVANDGISSHKYTVRSIPKHPRFLHNDQKAFSYILPPICLNAIALRDLAIACRRYRPIETDSLIEKNAMTYSSEVVAQQHLPHGRFTAFRDGRIRIVFEDRTIVEMNEERRVCQFRLPSGEAKEVATQSPNEFQGYVNYAMEFSLWAFSTEEERIHKVLRQQFRKRMVAQQTFKNHCLTSIIPIVKGDMSEEEKAKETSLPEQKQSSSRGELQEMVQKALLANEKHISSVQRMLVAHSFPS